jgi:DNA polymerase-3 subunit epsilon
MKFYTLDVETANPDYSTICQIGIGTFDEGNIIDSWKTYVDPEDYFDGMNISIHGIDEETVMGAPKFPEIYSKLKEKIEENVVVHHMPFDRVAFHRVCEKYALEPFNVKWLDSAAIARRTWEQFSHKGYGLSNLSAFLGIQFQHHDALEDSIAAGKVFLEASKKTGLGIDEWLLRISKPIHSASTVTLNLSGNTEGLLYGETIVFTGTLCIPRLDAAKLAAEAGCNVADSVNKTTTILVLGKQDSWKLKGEDKSSKHRKAEELMQKGCEIQIMMEDDFKKMVNLS